MLPDQYLTVGRRAVAGLVVKKSRFLCAVGPAETRAAAEAFIAAVSAEHKQATHNVPAFRVGLDQLQEWCSDAGEPSGTAGQPALRALQQAGVLQTALVVTRYFGGTLLGAPGLVRAYAEAARLGLEAAGTVQMQRHRRWALAVPYDLLGKVQYLLSELGARPVDAEYGAAVRLVADVPVHDAARAEQRIIEATAARVRPELMTELFLPLP